MPFIINDAQKQHLSLPVDVWEKIDSDRLSFSLDGNLISLSGFLSRVIVNYSAEAHASVAQRNAANAAMFYSLLSETPLSSNPPLLRLVQQKLTTSFSVDSSARARKTLANDGRKFRLDNDAKELLEDSEEYKHYVSLGAYLRALFIEYADLPFFERERVYFKQTISLIENAIEKKCMLILETRNGETPIRCAPYDIVRDRGDSFHYLIAFSITERDDVPYTIRSYRISRLESVKARLSERSFLTAKLEKEAESLKIKQDVAFFSDAPIDIEVRLTPRGYDKYVEQIRQRPNIAEVLDEEKGLFRFNCSYSQALFYFYKFGEDVEIISPIRLRQRFASSHKRAADLYQ